MIFGIVFGGVFAALLIAVLIESFTGNPPKVKEFPEDWGDLGNRTDARRTDIDD